MAGEPQSDPRSPRERVRVVRAGAVSVVELDLPAAMDFTELDRVNDAVRAAVDGRPGGRWVVDLSAVTYLGSAMLGLLVNVRQRVRDTGGRLVLCGLSPPLASAVRTCSLDRLLVVEPTRAAAVARAGK